MVLVFGEMKIREDLVFTRYGGVVRFVDTGAVNDKFRKLERTYLEEEQEEPADHMLALMVRGIFTSLTTSLHSFLPEASIGLIYHIWSVISCRVSHCILKGITGTQLHYIIWGGVRQLKEINLQVDCITCDGGKPNQNLFHDHIMKAGIYT